MRVSKTKKTEEHAPNKIRRRKRERERERESKADGETKHEH